MQAAIDTARPQAGTVGHLLREWRMARGISQLELAMRAGFSARHVSFIETGRTQPSRQALLAIAESLDVPLRDRNRLLEAGGFAHVYRQTPLSAGEMTHIRGILEFILEQHKPYGAVVHDRYSNCIMGNGAAAHLIEAIVDPSLLTDNVNFLRVAFHPLGARQWIVNWDDVSRHLWGRAERDLGSIRDDPAAESLLEELRGYAAPSASTRTGVATGATGLLLPIHVRKDDLELRLFSTLMTLGTPQDVTLQELRIETFFPADEASEQTWKRLAAVPRS